MVQWTMKLSLRPTLRTGGSLKLNWSQPECLLRSTQHPLAGIFCQDVLSLSPCCLSPCLPDLFMMCTYLKIFRCASQHLQHLPWQVTHSVGLSLRGLRACQMCQPLQYLTWKVSMSYLQGFFPWQGKRCHKHGLGLLMQKRQILFQSVEKIHSLIARAFLSSSAQLFSTYLMGIVLASQCMCL